MPKRWMTKMGATIAAMGAFLMQVPPDLAVGSYHGTAVTVGHLSLIVGALMTVLGLGRKLDRIDDKR